MDCPGVALDLSTRLSSGHYEDSTFSPLARHHLSSLLRRGVGRLFPGEIGKHLVTTTFVIAASTQLILLFALWAHIGSFEWRPPRPFLGAWTVVYVASWILLAIAMTNAGLGTQLGFLGWTAVYRGEGPVYKTFPQHGLYRICRHPVYFAMTLVSMSGPVWNVDHVIIAVVFVTY